MPEPTGGIHDPIACRAPLLSINPVFIVMTWLELDDTFMNSYTLLVESSIIDSFGSLVVSYNFTTMGFHTGFMGSAWAGFQPQL
jgi:hypothetical protein